MRRSSFLWAALLVALPLTATAAGQGTSNPPFGPRLFQQVPAVQQLLPQTDEAAVRQRNVWIDPTLLNLDDEAAQDQVGRVTLNLFEDLAWQGLYQGSESAYGGGTILTYRIEEDPNGYAWFSRVGDAVCATVRVHDTLYKVGYVGDGQHTVSEIDESAEPLCGTPESDGPGVIVPPGQPPLPPWYQYTIDVMVVYTDDARIANGGTDGMIALINLALYETNLGYSQSDVLPRVNLVCCQEISYAETGNETDLLNDLHDPADGVVDVVHTWRDDHGADVVVAIYDTGSWCGVAMGILCTLDPNWDTEAFCVVKDSCATGYFSFAHEIGHLQGAHHEGSGASCEVTPGCYGYRTPSGLYRTIMCYPTGTRLPVWSNPNKVAPNGEAMGVAGTEENWNTLNYTATTVSGWRPAKNYGHNLITLFASDNGFAGNMFDIEPKTDITINSFDLNVAGTVGDPVTVDLWYRIDSHLGYEDASAGWVYVGNGSGTCQGQDNYTHINLFNDLTFHANQVYGIYVDLTSYGGGQSLRYTDGGPEVFEDGYLKLTTGCGKGQGFSGPTFFPRMWNGQLHYSAAEGFDVLATTFAGGNRFAGNMFDVYAKKDLTINSFDVNVDTSAATGYITVDVWYKTGSHVGYETDPYSWTFLGTDYKAYGYGVGYPTPISVGPVDLQAGGTYSFYVHLDSYAAGHKMEYTNGTTSYENGDLRIDNGIGRGDEVFSGSIFNDRIWNGRIHYSIDAWTNLGYALKSNYGTPQLVGSGSLMPGEPMALMLSNARPGARSILVIGVSTWYAKFSGGVMVPAMDMFQMFRTDKGGNLNLKASWPTNIPQGMPVYMQYWIFDSTGPKGFAASNALQATTQ